MSESDRTQDYEAQWTVISRGRPSGRTGTVQRKHTGARRSDVPKLVPVAIAHTFLPRETLSGPNGDDHLYEARLTIDFAWKPGEAPVFSWTESYGGILASERHEALHAVNQGMRRWLQNNFRDDWRGTWLGQLLP